MIRTVPDPHHVVVSWVNTLGQCRTLTMTIEQARDHWSKLPQPLRETYTIRDAEPEDFK